MNSQTIKDQDVIAFIDGSSVLVVIVSYRTGKLVIDTLNSLTGELTAIPNMRVLVVDNTCGDDCKIIEAAIDEYNWQDWVKVKVSDRNGGFSYGNNVAIRPAMNAENSPDYIWLLNPDTQIHPGAGIELANFLEKNETVGIAGSCLINEDGAEWGFAFRFPTIISEIEDALQFGPFSKLAENHIVALKMGDEPRQVDWLPGASMMIRFDAFNSAGLFDEDYFLYYEETDFCLNAKSKGWTSWYIHSSKVMHIAGQSTGATGENATSRRLPPYMFDSRCHYFTKNHGYFYAIAADTARIIGLLFNKIIRFFRGKPNPHNPNLLWDSLQNFTILKSLNRVFKNLFIL